MAKPLKIRSEQMWAVRCEIKGTAYLGTSTLSSTRAEAIKKYLDMWDASVKPHYCKWKYWYGTRGYRCVKVEVKEIVNAN